MATILTLSRQLNELSSFGLDSSLILVNPQDLNELRASKQYRSHPRAVARPEWEGRCVGALAGRQVIETSQVDPGYPTLVLDAASVRRALRILREAQRILVEAKTSLAPTETFDFKRLWSKLRAIWKGSDSWTEKKASEDSMEEQPNR